MVEKRKNFKLKVNVRLEQITGEKELPEVMVYVFDNTGQYLSAKSVPKGGQGAVELDLPAEIAGAAVRVILAPPLRKEQEELPLWMDRLIHTDRSNDKIPSAAEIIRKGGIEKRIRLLNDVVEIAVLPPDWKRWILCPCVVRGRLIKRIPIPDGTTKELGVCHACIKIYDVDKIAKILLRLPERDLFRLRDDLWRIIKKPLPIPRVFPPPRPSPLEKSITTGSSISLVKSEVAFLSSHVSTPVIPLPPPEPKSIDITETQNWTVQIGSELESVFHTVSASQLRNELIARVEILFPFICALEWLKYWFHMDLLKCVCTDEQGRFETTIWYPCFGDKPDLYFRAVQCIGGTLHTLYDPGVACHTHWNYVCGTEVVLETDDPAANICVPLDPVEVPAGVSVWVMPYAVGYARLDAIKSSGLTDYTDDDGTWIDAPFGGTLGFRLGYSSGIPYSTDGKPAYYRWRYTKLDSAGKETEWREFAVPVADTVLRHYIDYDLNRPDQPPTYPTHTLGPQEKNCMHVYEFKPHQPPQIPNHKREWPLDDWFADIYSGILQSVNLPGGVADAAGIYKIKLEIYDKNANIISPTSGNFDFIVPKGLATDGVTVLTRKADIKNEIEHDGFVFNLQIDNNASDAEIFDASVNGVSAGACGFIEHSPLDMVTLSFRARHPNGFARFKFRVVRGSSGYVAQACAPDNPDVAWANAPLVTEGIVNDFNRDSSGIFAKEVNASVMRQDCEKAAFGVNLYVKATATNGWTRLSELDASAPSKAFALELKKSS